MEKDHCSLDYYRQRLGQLSPVSAKRKQILRQIFSEVVRIAGDDVNLQLQLLIEQAKKLSGDGLDPIQKTLCEREILAQAMGILEASEKLWRNYEEQYQDAYAEAWLKTLEYFYRRYRDYNAQQAQVATWLNFRLKNEFKTQREKQYQQRQQVQSSTSEDDREDLLAMITSPSYGQDADIMRRGIENWLQSDTELVGVTVKNQPAITAQLLLQRRFIEEVEWSQLAKEYGVAIATLSSFYERQCRGRLIAFMESNYDFIQPDTPINPCEHLRGLLGKKELRQNQFEQQLQEWIETESTLRELRLAQKPGITGQRLLQELLLTIRKPRQGLTQVAQSLGVEPGELERFYEFQLLPHILQFVHKNLSQSR
ncbi:hypothetical protein NON20_05620 [Synechocystis sp. B12]|nr:hypothetical protein NON20_05620 [Synechocystis sp. B12]